MCNQSQRGSDMASTAEWGGVMAPAMTGVQFSARAILAAVGLALIGLGWFMIGFGWILAANLVALLIMAARIITVRRRQRVDAQPLAQGVAQPTNAHYRSVFTAPSTPVARQPVDITEGSHG